MSPGFAHHLCDCLEHSQIAAHNLNVSHPSSFRQPLSFSVMQDNKSEASLSAGHEMTCPVNGDAHL